MNWPTGWISPGRGRPRRTRRFRAAVRLLLWLLPALALLPARPCPAQDLGGDLYGQQAQVPPVYQIRSERGDLFRIKNEKIFVEPSPDRVDICFAVASNIINPKVIVFNNSRTFHFDGGGGHIECLTRYTGFDYESFDLGRKRRTKQGLRGRSFGRRASFPQATNRRVDFFEGPYIKNANRILSKVLTFYPGYKTTILWLVDGSGEPLEESLVD